MLIDLIVALAMLFGVVQTDVLSTSPDVKAGSILAGLLIGSLGPLALRSPIRQAQIRDEQSPVGITYFYDVARLYAVYALDERFVRLRRRDVQNLRASWAIGGVTTQEIADEIRNHLAAHDRLAQDAKERIEESVSNALTLPADNEQMEALIKLLRAERFGALIDEIRSRAKQQSPRVDGPNPN